jgi:hypothetical protein
MHEIKHISHFNNRSVSLHAHPSYQPLEKKIVHELDNEGCKCNLCQKIVLNEMKVVKKTEFRDIES